MNALFVTGTFNIKRMKGKFPSLKYILNKIDPIINEIYTNKGYSNVIVKPNILTNRTDAKIS